MGKYTLSGTVDRFAGSRNGGTFQKSGNVFTIRRRAVPVQKQTSKQARARNGFESQAGRWRTYTAGQKNSWNTNAPLTTRTNSLGNTYTITGQQMNVSANQKRLFLGMSQIATTGAPIAPVSISESFWYMDRPATSLALDISIGIVQTGCTLSVFCGRPGPTQWSFSKQDCLFIGRVSSGNDANLKDWWNDFVVVYSPTILFQFDWIPVYMEVVQNNSGQVIYTVQGWALIGN